jgi:hypothetical protein
MTLCIAWTRQGEISFASDSRLTDGYGHVITDIATKIFTIRVNITTKDRRTLLFNLNYGMCFTGSYLNGSILADTISELLSSLMMDREQKIGADVIAQIALEIYKDVSIHLMNKNGIGGLSEMWLAGFCPKESRNRLFKFSWAYGIGNVGIDFTMKEELLEDPIIFLGNSNATSFANQNKYKIDFSKGYTEYHLLQEIIDLRDIHTVGGAIQTGHLLNGNFSLFGMVDYEITNLSNSTLYFVKQVYTFRGIPLVRAIESVEGVSINTSKISMAPFTEKRQVLELEVKQMNSVE